jgi:hypothetical protein
MELKEFLILSRPLSGRVEGRTALIQLDYSLEGRRPWFRSTGDDPLGKGMKLSAKCEVAEISIPASAGMDTGEFPMLAEFLHTLSGLGDVSHQDDRGRMTPVRVLRYAVIGVNWLVGI